MSVVYGLVGIRPWQEALQKALQNLLQVRAAARYAIEWLLALVGGFILNIRSGVRFFRKNLTPDQISFGHKCDHSEEF